MINVRLGISYGEYGARTFFNWSRVDQPGNGLRAIIDSQDVLWLDGIHRHIWHFVSCHLNPPYTPQDC